MRVHIADADDWVGIYIDGRLVYENHNIDPDELLKLLKIEHTQQWFEGELDQWGNRFPETQEELEA